MCPGLCGVELLESAPVSVGHDGRGVGGRAAVVASAAWPRDEPACSNSAARSCGCFAHVLITEIPDLRPRGLH